MTGKGARALSAQNLAANVKEAYCDYRSPAYAKSNLTKLSVDPVRQRLESANAELQQPQKAWLLRLGVVLKGA